MTCRLEIISNLLKSGITIRLDGDQLVVKPASRLTDHLVARLRAAKPELISILAGPSAACPSCGGCVVRDRTFDGYQNRICIGCGRWLRCLPPGSSDEVPDEKEIIPQREKSQQEIFPGRESA